MDTLKQMADRSPIDTIAGHLDSRIDTLHEEMLAALASLKELKAHDFQKVAEVQAALHEKLAAAVHASQERENALHGEMTMELAHLKELKAHDFQKVADAQTALREEFVGAMSATRDRQEALRNEMVNLFAAQEKAIMATMAATERAVGKSEMATEKRFDAVNLKSVEFSTKFPSLNLSFVRTDPFFNKPFPFIGLALGGVFGRDGLHEPVDYIGFDQIVRESGMLVVDSFD
jgi:ribosome-binding ATPase YchF (GTP1/OBG family)